jgi:hypothetical protein
MSKRADIVRWFQTVDQRTRAAAKDFDAFHASHPSLTVIMRSGGGVAMTAGIDRWRSKFHRAAFSRASLHSCSEYHFWMDPAQQQGLID